MSQGNRNNRSYNLSRSESVVALGIAAASSKSNQMYVTVKDISDYLDRSRSSVRAVLNRMEKMNVTESSEKKKVRTSRDPREKFWTLTYGVDYRGVQSLLEDHPEIEEQIAEEDINNLLSEIPQNEDKRENNKESVRFPTKERVDAMIDDYPEVADYLGGRQGVYELFDLDDGEEPN